MKHKRETGEREGMLAMTTGCHRTHTVEKGSARTVWFSVYLQFRSNKTDRSISIDEINHNQSSISGGCISSGGGRISGGSRSNSIKEEEKELPWLI